MNKLSSPLKKIAAFVLAGVLLLSALGGCTSGGPEKIDLASANYTVRAAGTGKLSPAERYGGASDAKLVDAEFLEIIAAAANEIDAEAYEIDLSGTRGEFDDVEAAAEYAGSFLESKGKPAILRSELESNGIWGALNAEGSGSRLVDNIQTLWCNRFENLDGEIEYVIDVSRNEKPLRTLRYRYEGGAKLLSSDILSNYDGREPGDTETHTPQETGSASTMYFQGDLHRTGIFEVPVLRTVEFLFSMSAKPVEGEVPGGFAGMLEGTVTMDGVTISLTADGNGIPVPLGLVDDPSQYYIGFSRCPTNNPQDTTGYRNVFFVRTDFSEVVGLYMTYRSAKLSEWFSCARVTKSSYDGTVAKNNEALTALYAAIMNKAYGSKKEYNNTLAILYNMMIGVEQSYLKKNLPAAISNLSSDIRDYSECYTDETVARLGENDFWFFPDGRSTVCRIYEYDGQTAIAAVDFSTKQDNGYGGLYRGSWDGSRWSLEILKDGRIK